MTLSPVAGRKYVKFEVRAVATSRSISPNVNAASELSTPIHRRAYRRALLVVALAAASLTGPVPGLSATIERQSCPHIPSGGGEDLQGFIVKLDGSCTAQNGSYIRGMTYYTLHALAEAYGQCTLRASDCSPLPCTCVTTGTQFRRPANVGVVLDDTSEGSPHNLGPIYPNDTSLQLWDSRVSGQQLLRVVLGILSGFMV